MRAHLKIIAALFVAGAIVSAAAFGQAGRKPGAPNEVGKERGMFLNVVAARADGSDERVTAKQLALYDGGSKTHFDSVFRELLHEDITVYALQIPDRTGGALRRDRLKPGQVIQKLTEGTGGRVLSVSDSREAAKAICDELRKSRYVLAYTPTSLPLYETRRLLIVPDEGISVRHKLTQPGN